MKTSHMLTTGIFLGIVVGFCCLAFVAAEERPSSLENQKKEKGVWQISKRERPLKFMVTAKETEEPKKKREPLVYKPPKRGVPSGREGGGTRGGSLAVTSGENFTTTVLDVLAPGPNQMVGVTHKEQPDLYWYISEPKNSPIIFTINDEAEIQPLLEVELKPPSKEGIHRIALAKYGIRLTPGKMYRWYIALVPDPGYRSRDIIAGARIERREAKTSPVDQSGDHDILEAVYRNAEEGLWYDAIAAISEAIENDPQNSMLHEMRATLLDQAELPNIAEHDRTRQAG